LKNIDLNINIIDIKKEGFIIVLYNFENGKKKKKKVLLIVGTVCGYSLIRRIFSFNYLITLTGFKYIGTTFLNQF
jgi:phosphomannomutase